MAYNCTGRITIKHKDSKMPEILNVYTRLFDQVDIKEAYGTFYDRLTQMTGAIQTTFDATFTITKIEENV